jgi:DNA-binding protein H-NS
MNQKHLKAMSVEELWELHQEISSVLEKRIRSEIGRLEHLSESLEQHATSLQPSEPPRRRPYPKVLPKFQNPERPSETWAGRGKQPHWVTELLQAGKNIEDLRIAHAAETVPA